MVLRVKILVLVMFLIACTKLWAQDEVFVNGFEPVPELFLDASPEVISLGESTTITWSVIDAESCVKLGDWSGVAAGGTGIHSQMVMPNNLPASYSMQCSNQFGYSPIRTVVIEAEVVNPPTLVFYANPTSVDLGETTNLTWFVEDASSCIASVMSGAASGWSGQVNSSDGTHNKVVSLAALPVQFGLTCSNHVGQVYKTVTIVENSGSTNPPTLTLWANPPTILQGESTTINWNTSDASGCTASSNPAAPGWSGSKATAGTMTFSGLNSTTTFSMTCYNSFGSVMKNVTVNVTEPLCTTYPVAANRVDLNYSTENGGFAFGESDDHEWNIITDIENSNYVSYEFFSPNFPVVRRLDFAQPPSFYDAPFLTTVSVSECPGNFTSTAVCKFTINIASYPFILLSNTGNSFCNLDSGKTYYLNVINSQYPENTPPSCAFSNSTSCAVLFSEADGS